MYVCMYVCMYVRMYNGMKKQPIYDGVSSIIGKIMERKNSWTSHL